MEIQYNEIDAEISNARATKDSLIYNTDFRLKTLGSSFSAAEFNSAIEANDLRVEIAIKKLEILFKNRVLMEGKYRIFQMADLILEFLFAITALAMLYYWVKPKRHLG